MFHQGLLNAGLRLEDRGELEKLEKLLGLL